MIIVLAMKLGLLDNIRNKQELIEKGDYIESAFRNPFKMN
jgi:hypothetical protein